MPNVLRIVVVDSDPESRSSLRKILGGTPGAVVVGEFGEVRQAMLETPDRRPDLLLIEVPSAAAGRDGDASGETIRKFAEALPEAAILAMGTDVSAETVIKAIRAGAFEFLPRPVERADLTAALEKIPACGGGRHPAPGRPAAWSRRSRPRVVSA